MIHPRSHWNPNASLRPCFSPLDSWVPPPPGWIKLNFDGSVKSGGIAGAGYIIRDHYANFICCGGRRILTRVVHIAEKWAALEGLKAIPCDTPRTMGIWLEGDSMEILQLIFNELERNGDSHNRTGLQSYCLDHQQYGVVDRLFRGFNFTSRDPILANIVEHLIVVCCCRVSYIQRNNNSAADFWRTMRH
ncbi:hypothetical protein AXF42_Ash016879 [Apostasia shenzhenica]|uniref:RNase H type-1 domain-containing protein n=1 Tax=Apostasia shenzhenica TaxID=1088818 RepID=A0A2H9ZRD0_9ASPA|nr:hypothetical protein AXF42_Ash016879 [Apostasia shenzhenica]